MTPATHPSQVTVDVHIGDGDIRRALERDVGAGLTAREKSLPPVWFYDERGSSLFDEITRLDEYYLTRAEREILTARADTIARRAEADTLVELGSGTSEKTRLLLDALAATGRLQRFVPFDVSGETLRRAAAAIAADYPGVHVHAVVGDFHRHLACIPAGGRRLIAFLGSTIGNLTTEQRRRFLGDVRASMDDGDHLLLGTDLVKDAGRLQAAYDDAAGVTAAFNRNVLAVLNRELGADFDPDAFEHVARWNEDERWMEMRLRARRPVVVRIAALGLHVAFDGGEDLLTEISAKFTPEQVGTELQEAGFEPVDGWTDAADDFLVTLASPTGPPGESRQGVAASTTARISSP